eukprot:TRINITY_DN3562_c0_g1_i1.p1 TRINITY_DN3562_c0_g1~~TRINITY_DN3562_c0_g1_i1.p1  ORF type:complete len:175 (+),score=41.07 TRINITY_DN3562_c0_g1_i1:80-604(+)
MYLRRPKAETPEDIQAQEIITQKLNERSIAYTASKDSNLNLQFVDSNDDSVESQISNIINLDEILTDDVLVASMPEHIDILLRILPGHTKLTWISISVPSGGEYGLEGLVYFYADQENVQEDSYPVCYFSVIPGIDTVHVPIKSSKYGSLVKIKIIRGSAEGIRLSKIALKGRK